MMRVPISRLPVLSWAKGAFPKSKTSSNNRFIAMQIFLTLFIVTHVLINCGFEFIYK